MSKLETIGFTDIPFSYSGVPNVIKKYKPIGLENEINELLRVYNIFKQSNENILVIIVGEYGWGKTELLDLFESYLTKYENVDTLRIPLTYGLDPKFIINEIKKLRKDITKPLILLIDEADELTRLAALNQFIKDSKFQEFIVQVGTFIRAILEPKQYRYILGPDYLKFIKIMLVIAFTPQLYYNILKNVIPDVFDVTRGRVFKEIVIDKRIPFWLYESIVKSRLYAYSNSKRIELLKKGLIDELHPLRIEYLATLYYLIYLYSKGYPSPRELIKYTSKLFSKLLDLGAELNYEIFLQFLHEVKHEGLKINFLALNDYVNSLDEQLKPIFLTIALSVIPRSIKSIKQELKNIENIESKLKILKTLNLIEQVYVIKIPITEIDKINVSELTIPEVKDLKSLSLFPRRYYTRLTDEGLTIFMVTKNLPDKVKEFEIAFQLTDQVFVQVYNVSRSGIVYEKIRSILTKSSEILKNPDLLSDKITEIVSKILQQRKIISDKKGNIHIVLIENDLDLRNLVIISYVRDYNDIEKLKNFILNTVNNGVIDIHNELKYFDSLVVFIVSNNILSEEIEKYTQELHEKSWKIPEFKLRDFTKIFIYGSDRFRELNKLIIGYNLSKIEELPREYEYYLAELNNLAKELNACINQFREKILKLTLGIRKGKESKYNTILKIIQAWINDEELPDQPEVFKDSNGKAKISEIELALYRYLIYHDIEIISIKELEQLIRKLFPVHLWREFKEKDLIELMRLRGLLLPLDQKCTKFRPFRINYVSQYLDLVKKIVNYYIQLSQVKYVVKVLGKEIEVLVKCYEVEQIINDILNIINRINNFLKLNTGLENEHILKQLAMINTTLEKLKDVYEKCYQNISNKVREIEVQYKSIEDLVKELRDKANRIEAINIKQIFEDQISEIEDVIISLTPSKIEDLSKTEIMIKDLKNMIQEKINELEKVYNIYVSASHQVDELEEILLLNQKLSKIFNRKNEVLDINVAKNIRHDLEILLNIGEIELLNHYLTDLKEFINSIRRNVSTYLTQLNSICKKLVNSYNWICIRCRKIIQLPKDFCNKSIKCETDSLDEIIQLQEELDKIIYKVSEILNVDYKLIKCISEIGINMGIEIDELSKCSDIPNSKVIELLEKLCKIGIIEKKYVA